MKIPPSQIASFLHESRDEVEIRQPDSGVLVGTFLRHEILNLAAGDAIAGVLNNKGTYLRYCTALISVRAIHRICRNVASGGRGITAEDNYTVTYKPGKNGGTYSHNLKRSYAYAH